MERQELIDFLVCNQGPVGRWHNNNTLASQLSCRHNNNSGKQQQVGQKLDFVDALRRRVEVDSRMERTTANNVGNDINNQKLMKFC